MGIRVRLLLAFVPLLLILIGLIGLTPLANQQILAFAENRTDETNRLLDVQDMITLILLQHDRLSQYMQTEDSSSLDQYYLFRAQALDLSNRQFEGDVIDIGRELAIDYLSLSRRHDEVLELANNGNFVAARVRFSQPDIKNVLDKLVSKSQQFQARSRAQVATIDTLMRQFQQQMLIIVIGTLTVGLGIGIAVAAAQTLPFARALERLTDDADRFAVGGATGELTADTKVRELRRLRDAFQHLLDANLARQRHLAETLGEIESRMMREEALQATVQALSVPVVPLSASMLLLPLIGVIDDERAREINRILLEAIQTRRARQVVIDVTGLAESTNETAVRLRRIAEAAQLLGCKVILVGVRAEQAVALTESGLAQAGVLTARDIPAVLAMYRS